MLKLIRKTVFRLIFTLLSMLFGASLYRLMLISGSDDYLAGVIRRLEKDHKTFHES